MDDLEICLEDRPGALAELGEALGAAGVSIEGGGGFVTDGKGIMHFLFQDGVAARLALQTAGIEVRAMREVLVQKLDQETPGQLGRLCRRMAEAGVNILVQYSDHQNNLILAVDDLANGKRVAAAWTQERDARKASA
jgi:hypothetical protein